MNSGEIFDVLEKKKVIFTPSRRLNVNKVAKLVNKAAGVKPNKWFKYVLDNLSRYQYESLELTELLPKNWKAEDK